MKRRFKMFHQRSNGFTLVELLIVIALLGILAAVVLPNVTGLAGNFPEIRIAEISEAGDNTVPFTIVIYRPGN